MKNQSFISRDQKTLLKNWEKHRGSIVMVVGDKIFSTNHYLHTQRRNAFSPGIAGKLQTQGVGGSSKVYLLNNNMRVRIGSYERKIPIGFLSHDYIPPLFGRHELFETFRVVLDKFSAVFNDPS